MNYDGSIKIDTRLDVRGFNAGMRRVQSSAAGALRRLMPAVAAIGIAASAAVAAVALIGAAIVAASVVAIRSTMAMVQSIKNSVSETDALYELALRVETQFNRIRASILALFGTLLQAALPAIIKIVDWLVRMLNIINQIVAALLGQKTVMRVVASSTDAVAAHTAKAARNTEKLKKAAQGALAAFDQIDVLQRKTDTGADAGAADAGGGLQFEEVPIDQKWLTLAEQIKQSFLDAIERIRAAWARFVEAWNAFWSSPFGQLIVTLWQNFIDTWRRILENTRETLQRVKEGVERIFKGISQFFSGIIAGDWRRAWEGLKNIVGGVMDVIKALVVGTLTNILIFFDGWKKAIRLSLEFVLSIWRAGWEFIRVFSIGVIKTIQGAWADFASWFQRTVINPLRDNFGRALDWIREKFSTAFSGIGNIARGAFNGLVDAINGILQRIATAINGMAQIVNPLSWMFGWSIPTVFAPQIPRLATGAVIPPNSEFLAVLGDQRTGRNIEAPAAMFEEMLKRAVESGQRQEIVIRFEGTMGELARLMKPAIDKENARVGHSLATGNMS